MLAMVSRLVHIFVRSPMTKHRVQEVSPFESWHETPSIQGFEDLRLARYMICDHWDQARIMAPITIYEEVVHECY